MGMSALFRNCYRDTQDAPRQEVPAPARRPKRLEWGEGQGCENAFTRVGIVYSIDDHYYIVKARGYNIAQSVSDREAARAACQAHYDAFVDSLMEDV